MASLLLVRFGKTFYIVASSFSWFPCQRHYRNHVSKVWEINCAYQPCDAHSNSSAMVVMCAYYLLITIITGRTRHRNKNIIIPHGLRDLAACERVNVRSYYDYAHASDNSGSAPDCVTTHSHTLGRRYKIHAHIYELKGGSSQCAECTQHKHHFHLAASTCAGAVNA